ncbi:MAG: SusF/SusE family outer membrane protein [Bacteroidales bacterium]|nr:SusF/SusE family outer membrane protein [Bacteroidales bacterium]
MKKYFKLIALAGLAALFVASCKKPEETPEPQKPASLTAPTLSVTPGSVVVSPESEDVALTFSWNDVAVEGITPVYAFQITKKGDNDFASGTAFECTSTEKKFNHAELATLAGEIGASLDEGFSLIARVRVTAKDKKDVEAVLSNVVEVAVSKEQYPIQNLYPIGNGTPYGWSQDKTVAMEKTGSTFSWTGHLYANAEFKFLLQNDGNWWPGVVNKSDDPYNYEPVIGFGDADDKKFKVDKEGKYTISIDASNTNALKMFIEFIDDDIQTLVVDHLYILGGATKTGWSLDAMEEFEKNGNIFTWEGSLTEGGEFRFPMQRDWWPCLMIAMDGETLVKGVSDDEKTGYTVDETAIYKIVCDIDNMKVSITKTGDIVPPDFPTLFMCGDATPYGWSTVMTDENQLKPVESSNVNVLSWTGELKASGHFKFLTTSDWVPSYNRDATAADYWTLVYRENYDQPDEQFAVAEDGTYKVVVDLDAMKVTCTKEEAAPVRITIDGDMSEWAGVTDQVSSTKEEPVYMLFKVANDDEYIYFYSKRDNRSAIWNRGGYIYYDIDADNNPETGVEKEIPGLEMWLYFFPFDAEGTIATDIGSGSAYPSKDVFNSFSFAGAVSETFVELEARMSLSDAGVKKGDVIAVYTWSNKSGDDLKKTPITYTVK